MTADHGLGGGGGVTHIHMDSIAQLWRLCCCYGPTLTLQQQRRFGTLAPRPLVAVFAASGHAGIVFAGTNPSSTGCLLLRRHDIHHSLYTIVEDSQSALMLDRYSTLDGFHYFVFQRAIFFSCRQRSAPVSDARLTKISRFDSKEAGSDTLAS